jgi:wyosine [tRNA(Phe)-imidazoG37] synthetase (radical SAM superfamily)
MKRLELPQVKVDKFEIWLNKNCNFSCEYCGVHDNSKKDSKISEETIKHLKSYFKYVRKDAFVTILGGEPTLSKDLFYLIDILKKYGFSDINVYTNMENTDVIRKLTEKNISLLATYHPDQTTLKKFLEKTKPFKENIKQMMIMYDSKTSKQNIREYKVLKSLFHQCTLEPTYQIKSNGDMIKDELFDFIDKKLQEESSLLRLKNPVLDMKYYNILEKGLNKCHKKCTARNESIIFDLATNERYNCYTESGMKRKYNTEIEFENGYCITECSLNLEHLVEVKCK